MGKPLSGATYPVSERFPSILNRNQVAIINDNDFGIAGVDAPTQLWMLLLADQLPLKE